MRKKHPEHVNLERWLVSYADFITLLFAFFVVMYAISQADIVKFKKVAASIKSAFDAAGPVGTIDLHGNAGGNTANIFDPTVTTGGRALNLPAGKTNTASAPDPELQNLKEMLEETISLELGTTDLSDKMQMQFDSRGLIVRLAAKDFFATGSSVVSPDLRPLLESIGRVVARTSHLIRIEGHTDPSEKDGWALSVARAQWVAEYWLKRFDLPPRQVGIAGYSHFRPLNESKNEFQRAANRRVEIIILNNKFEAP